MSEAIIYVCTPGGHVSGGPEVLHQFVDCMRSLGRDARILYTPFEKKFSVPEPYSHYDIVVEEYDSVDHKNGIFILPELNTRYAQLFPPDNVFIWWLSVDNYLGRMVERSRFVEKYRHVRNVLRGKKLPVFKMRRYRHLVQSEYARIFLAKRGISSQPLTDYLNAIHLQDTISDTKRENIVAYNPKKGIRVTRSIIANMPDVTFVPIQNMTFLQVRELLQRSKVYIDFGGHPGKDRFPREAAMAGCCIITGKLGSAANNVDVPIPSQYKIDEDSSNFINLVRQQIEDIFTNNSERQGDYDAYRETIRQEPAVFEQQVAAFLKAHTQ